MITVVNKKIEKFTIYIGRPGPFGNPFIIGKDGTREEVVKKFRDWFYSNSTNAVQMRLDARCLIFDNSVLGCFCKPELCHGDIIAEYINDLDR